MIYLRNIIIITIDSLRPDHTSVYGYYRDTTPFLKSLVSKFKVYKNAYANGSHTASSFISSFTSTYPLIFAPSKLEVNNLWKILLKHRITFPEILNKYEYETIAFNIDPFLSKYMLGLTSRFSKAIESLPGIIIGSSKHGEKRSLLG